MLQFISSLLPTFLLYLLNCIVHYFNIWFAAEEQIWREVVLSQLLTLVDIPLLDPILSYDHTAVTAFSNLAFHRVESSSSLLHQKYVGFMLDRSGC